MHWAFAHNGIFVAIIAHGLIGVTLVWDKILLRQPETRNLVSYVFWLGFISIFGLLLIPFGFHIPSAPVIGIAFGAGLLQMAAMFFYYAALKAGEASQTLAIMGGFSPVATALISIPLLRNPIGGRAVMAGFLLLVLGGFVMFMSEKTDLEQVLPNVLAGLGGLRHGERAAEAGLRSNELCERIPVFYVGHVLRSAAAAGATFVAASDFQKRGKGAQTRGGAELALVFRESIPQRAGFLSRFLCNQPDAARAGGRNYRSALCNDFCRLLCGYSAAASIVTRAVHGGCPVR